MTRTPGAWFRICRPFGAALVLVCGVGTPALALPDDEDLDIDAPAGDMPDADMDTAAGDYGDYGSEATGTATGATDETTTDGAPAANPASEPVETWDSYSDLVPSATSAEEITDGVRVEDIVEPPSDYRFAAFGKADPFVPPLITEDNSVDPLEIPIVSPLQRYALADLGIVGIWQLSNGERKAMVMTPDKNGIIVKNGDPIGNRGGKILGIGTDYLTVREFSLAPDGTRQFEDQQMFMGGRRDVPITGTIRFNPGDPKTVLKLDNPDAAKPAAGPAVKIPGGEPGGGDPRDDKIPDNAMPENGNAAAAEPVGNLAADAAAGAAAKAGNPANAAAIAPNAAEGQPPPLGGVEVEEVKAVDVEDVGAGL